MNPFGGGQTGGGPGSAQEGKQSPAGQFGGNGSGADVISLGSYFAAVSLLQASGLHILYVPGTFVAVSRMQGSLQVDAAGSIKDIRALEALYGYQYELVDSPPIEIAATFELMAAPKANTPNDSKTGLPSNFAEFYAAYTNAGTYALAEAFLVKWFSQTQTQAMARLAAVGIMPPA